jgi:hypothetical protein
MIKIDMEMPAHCEDCIFRDCTLEYRTYWKCWAYKKEDHRYTTFETHNPKSTKKPEWCPLIEVKEKYCHNCGHKNSENEINCRLCGANEEDSEWEPEE